MTLYQCYERRSRYLNPSLDSLSHTESCLTKGVAESKMILTETVSLTWHSYHLSHHALMLCLSSAATSFKFLISSGSSGLSMWRAKWERDGCGRISKLLKLYTFNMDEKKVRGVCFLFHRFKQLLQYRKIFFICAGNKNETIHRQW